MSLARDLWMTPAKRRLLRRTTANGPYGPPDSTEYYEALVYGPEPNILHTTGQAAPTLVVGDPVIFRAKEGTGTPEARAAVETLRAMVDDVSGDDVAFSTAPADLTGIDLTGLVLMVWKV